VLLLISRSQYGTGDRSEEITPPLVAKFRPAGRAPPLSPQWPCRPIRLRRARSRSHGAGGGTRLARSGARRPAGWGAMPRSAPRKAMDAFPFVRVPPTSVPEKADLGVLHLARLSTCETRRILRPGSVVTRASTGTQVLHGFIAAKEVEQRATPRRARFRARGRVRARAGRCHARIATSPSWIARSARRRVGRPSGGAGVVGGSEARRPLGGSGDIWLWRPSKHPHEFVVYFHADRSQRLTTSLFLTARVFHTT
jgi:hypothetical protein